MDERITAERWERIESLLDAALTLPMDQRTQFLSQSIGDDRELLQKVQALLDNVQTRGDVLDRPAAESIVRTAPVASLEAGSRVGAYRVLELVGRGGMGEVYLAERADGQFEHQVALKLIRREAVEHIARFEIERRTLAQLDHPGIARLFDGGLAEDGRPYMVMEWVEGRSITQWCREQDADLRQRLEIFLQVCDAVAYAHRNLLVHRDLKPGNVLVTGEGRSKLLDFGVAKLLSGSIDVETQTQAPITPAYAAPEQLTQAPVTTATDVYALGLLLFELLTAQRAWHRPGMSLAQLMDRQLRESTPVPSVAASKLSTPPVSSKALRGDLDAIVGHALRAEPERRYHSAAELGDDLRRYLEGRPVLAQPESLGYTLRKLVQRNRTSAAFAGLALTAVVAGLGVSLWQVHQARIAARTAEREAARATATKDFLVRVFRASDPRIAQDKPRGQVTAKELLDLSAPKIAQEFASDPDTEIQLLGVTASIYRELGDQVRYEALHKQQVELASAQYGELHPAIIDGLIDDADHANDRNEYPDALKWLEQADSLIHRAGLDHSAIRARWYLVRSDVTTEDDGARKAGEAALDQAAQLYAEVAPTDPGYMKALTSLGYRNMGKHPPESEQYFRKAIAAAQSNGEHNDAVLQQLTYPGLAANLEGRGDYAGAEDAYEHSADLARKTYGEAHSTSWVPAAEYAWMVHRQGDRDRAHALFEHLMQVIPPIWKTDSYDDYAREYYASCLAAEGRAQQAIPLLEAALRVYIEKPGVEYEQRRNRLILGDAYDRVGRFAEARSMLKSSLDERLAKEPEDSGNVRAARERWGRFLLEQNDVAGAEAQFAKIIALERDRKLATFALAHAGMAQVALARQETATALTESQVAVDLFDHVTGRRDVRFGPYIWLVHSRALRLSGDKKGAREWAQRALDASRKYDDPAASSITQAQAALRAAEL